MSREDVSVEVHSKFQSIIDNKATDILSRTASRTVYLDDDAYCSPFTFFFRKSLIAAQAFWFCSYEKPPWPAPGMVTN